MSMSVAELRTEIQTRYEQSKQIDDKYADGLTPAANAEDFEQVKKLLSEIDGLEAQLAPLEDAETRTKRIKANVDRLREPATTHRHPGDFNPADWPQLKDAGWQFLESPDYKRLADSGIFMNPRARVELNVPLVKGTRMLGHKALVFSGTGVGGPMIQNDVRPGSIDILQRELTLLDLIPRSGTDSDTVEYVREKTFTNNAAFVAEATATTGTSGLKPESVLEFETQTSPVRTLAHWIPVTNRMLADAPAIRGIINQRLLMGLDLALETQIISGNGTGENLTGLLNTAGVLIQGLGADSVPDAIYKARTQVMVTGLARPSAVVMHPNDWQAVRLGRENAATGTLGAYLYGPPSISGPATLWGYPVVESLGMTENTAVIGDFPMGCTYFDREAANIRVGLIDDQFVRNMQTILAELRGAFVVWRPTAFAKVTGV